MTILSFGCSLTFGTDLPDAVTEPIPMASKLTWPSLISAKLGVPYFTRSSGGCGNLAILDRVSRHLHHFPAPKTLVIINWTFIDRFDFSHPSGMHFNSGVKDYQTLTPTGQDQLSKFYYRNFHSEYKDKYTNLIYIKTALDLLEQQSIPFIMTAVDDLLWCTQWHAPPHLRKLQSVIKPHIADFEGQNFVTWSKSKGFDLSQSGHPLVNAHEAAADLLLNLAMKKLH